MDPLPVARSAFIVAAALVSPVYDAAGPTKPFDVRNGVGHGGRQRRNDGGGSGHGPADEAARMTERAA
jgi:hypothetical protein